jgi:glutaredoxin 3
MPKIVMYTKNVCPYCSMAQRLLSSKGVEWDEINIEAGPGLRDEMIELTGRTTVPQIFIGDQHVGGFDDLDALDRAGGLDPLLNG